MIASRLSFTLICALLLTFSSNAAVIYVDLDATGSNNGSSWTNAYTDLQDALAAANSGDNIWVAEGVYKPTTTTNRDISFTIPSGVSLYGGFNGTESALTERDWNANSTVLSGAIGSQVDITDNTKILIKVSSATEAVLINGFKIRRAYNETFVNFQITSSIVSFRNCEFFLNNTEIYMMYAQFSDVDFINCLFRENDCGQMFAAANEATLTFTNTTTADNTMNGHFFVSLDQAAVNVYNSILWNPGGFEFHDPTTIDHSLVSDTDFFNLGTNMSDSDPLFVDPATDDYSLQDGSPAIDLGSDAYISQGYDLARNLRIYGDAPDAGAYEARTPSLLYVDVDATGLNNGASWSNAFNDLQDALAIAIPGDEIWVAEGIYYPTTGTSRGTSFAPSTGLSIYGGFDGTETQRNQRDWTTHLSILSGDIGTPNDNTDNSYHVVRLASTAADYLLNGFVIENGNANSGSLNGEGGGITIQGAASADIRNCWIRNNYGNLGGGIHMRFVSDNVTIGQSIIQNNDAQNGAAIWFGNSPDIESCVFTLNQSTAGATVFGDAGGDLELTNCTFYLNDVPNDGTKVLDGAGSGDDWLVANSIFWNNAILAGTPVIHDQGATGTVHHCILQNGAYTGNGYDNYVGSPLFVNPLAGNLALQNNSPGMNAGDNSVVEEARDAIRNERIRFGTVDIGAVEGDFVPQGVIFVDIDASGANDGSSWENAFNDFGDALDAVAPGEDIWVAEGTYLSSGAFNWIIDDAVDVFGGFDGTEWEVDQAQPLVHESILSGNVGDPADVTDNEDGLIFATNTPSGSTLNGFVIEGNYDGPNPGGYPAFSLNTPAGDGVGTTSNFKITNCIFRGNYSEGNRSCIGAAPNSLFEGDVVNLTVENCLFYENAGSEPLISAGNGNGFITIVNCTFSQNEITDPTRGLIADNFTAPTIYNCISWGNSVSVDYEAFCDVYHSIYEFSSPAGNNNLMMDPMFTDPMSLDFTLLEGSPAVNAGEAAFVDTTTDLAGNLRIQESQVDMGCFESPFANTCLGDFDNDGLIAASDLLVLLGAYGGTCGGPFCGGDMNGDTVVDTSDLLAFLSVFGSTCP